MSDYKESQGVKSQRDNEIKVEIVDGQSSTSATKKLSVVQDADTYVDGTNDFAVPVAAHSSDGKLRLLKTDAVGNLYVITTNPSGSTIQSTFTKSTAVANGTPVNVDTLITSGKTVSNLQAQVSSLGMIGWQLGTWDGAAFVPYAESFTVPASPRATITSRKAPVGDGTLKIRLIITNIDLTATDCYSTVEWLEQ